MTVATVSAGSIFILSLDDPDGTEERIALRHDKNVAHLQLIAEHVG